MMEAMMIRTREEPPLEYTGERMVPEAADSGTFWEHIYRYKFASRLVAGRRVLDVACGEGYGAAALAGAGASRVVGVDVSRAACEHAARRYGLAALAGDATRLPLPDACVDVVVSFETIEHLDVPEAFLDECRRVLAPGGTIIISTPNGAVYGSRGGCNPFHHREMDEAEFVGLLRERFRRPRLFTQGIESAAWWSLRSSAARRSPWSGVRGYWRARQALCPQLGRGEAASRGAPVEAILASDRPGSVLVNPYRLHRRSSRSREAFTYLIAVADR